MPEPTGLRGIVMVTCLSKEGDLISLPLLLSKRIGKGFSTCPVPRRGSGRLAVVFIGRGSKRAGETIGGEPSSSTILGGGLAGGLAGRMGETGELVGAIGPMGLPYSCDQDSRALPW